MTTTSTDIKVENKLSIKLITLIFHILWILFITISYVSADTINCKITLLYILGLLISIWCIPKALMVKVYVKDNSIKYQSKLPFIYKKTDFNEIAKIALNTKTNGTGDIGSSNETYNVITFYSKQDKLFSINMTTTVNSNKLYQKAKSHYGIKVEDKRKK
jgi:amino acid transporter